jgi:hypothetical protein
MIHYLAHRKNPYIVQPEPSMRNANPQMIVAEETELPTAVTKAKGYRASPEDSRHLTKEQKSCHVPGGAHRLCPFHDCCIRNGELGIFGSAGLDCQKMEVFFRMPSPVSSGTSAVLTCDSTVFSSLLQSEMPSNDGARWMAFSW